MATITKQNASERMVILLRPSEKLRVKRMARKERVSSAEIVRRSLSAYDDTAPQALSPKLLAEMNAALDGALASVRSNLEEIKRSREEIDRLRAERT